MTSTFLNNGLYFTFSVLLTFFVCSATWPVILWCELRNMMEKAYRRYYRIRIYQVAFCVEVLRKRNYWHHQALTTFDVRQGEQQKGNISNFTKHCRFQKHTSNITKSLHIQLIFTSHKTFVCFWQNRMRAFTKYFLFTLH